jgi:hypothetical protein
MTGFFEAGGSNSGRHCEERLVRRSSTTEGGSDEAIHLSALPHYGLLRGACHRARIRATRWLAMSGLLLQLPEQVSPPIGVTVASCID